MSVADEIRKLVDLRNQGDITKAEYELLKAGLIASLAGGSTEPKVIDGQRRSRQNPWKPAELIDVIRAASSGQVRLTIQHYSNLRKSGEVEGPTPAIFIKSFGSWSAACEAAGVQSGEPRRTNYTRRWSNDDLLEFVVEYVRESRKSSKGLGTAGGFENWLGSLKASREVPSFATVRNRLGSWSQMRDSAMAVIEQEDRSVTNWTGRELAAPHFSATGPTEAVEAMEDVNSGDRTY
tara:strand:- start:11 stop:718 length:708 start_codon:yes stop_codon:yes gene_type:complete